MVPGEPHPAACREARGLEVGEPGVVRGEVARDLLLQLAARRAALAAEVGEEDFVILHAADRERVIDAQRAQVAEDLVRGGAVHGVELLLDLVHLADVALVELVVLFLRLLRDALELPDGGERLRGEFLPGHDFLRAGRG